MFHFLANSSQVVEFHLEPLSDADWQGASVFSPVLVKLPIRKAVGRQKQAQRAHKANLLCELGKAIADAFEYLCR